jgi:hypothetical protein
MATTACPEGYWGPEPEYEHLAKKAKKINCKKTIKKNK